jgi:hypothetical protein
MAIRAAAPLRLYSVANGCFRATKLQWRLSGDETGEVIFASRPKAIIRFALIGFRTVIEGKSGTKLILSNQKLPQ